jgi:hypothetical protein
MKYIFTLLACLIFGSTYAETIQNVTYQLPPAAKNWVVGNKLGNDKEETIIYIPKGTNRQNAQEFFGVNANRLPSDLNDLASIKSELDGTFPNMHIDLYVLEKSKDSLIYEWSAFENGAEKAHGLGRIFSNKDGTVTLLYQTKNIPSLSQARSIWLSALKAAQQ